MRRGEHGAGRSCWIERKRRGSRVRRVHSGPAYLIPAGWRIVSAWWSDL